jgi:predicted dehydrogenase
MGSVRRIRASNGHVRPSTPSTVPVSVAVVGLGYWGPNLVRALLELPEAELACVCDLQPERLEVVRRRYPGLATTTSFADVLDDPAIETVAIATPVSTHYPLAAQALKAGKHVFVEKPLASSSAEAIELIELAERHDRILMPGHTFLYSPPVNVVRELIAAGELGTIYFISTSRVNLGIHQSDASVTWDLAPHDFSILRYWVDGLPTHLSALSRGCVFPDTPDVAFINLEFESGTIAHVELSWLAPSKLRRTTIVGSEKMVVYDDASPEPVRIFDSGASVRDPETFGEYKLTYRTGDILSPRVDVVEPLVAEMADLCGSVRSRRQPRSTSSLGLDVVRMIEAVDVSLGLGGARVALNGLGTSATLEPAAGGPA